MATREWFKPGVYNLEEMNPEPFMSQIANYGLPWNIVVNEPLPVNQKD